MILDALVTFVPIQAPLSLVGAAAQTFPSLIVDLLGNGVGQAPSNIIGTAAVWGTDQGIGAKRPELNVTIGTGLAGTVGTTLKAALQAAIDTGSGGGYLPGPWTDIVSQDLIALANVTGGAVAGAVIFRSPFLPTMPANLRPRFLQLLFSPQYGTPPTTPAGFFTSGTISSAFVTMVRDDQGNKFQPKNFTVA